MLSSGVRWIADDSGSAEAQEQSASAAADSQATQCRVQTPTQMHTPETLSSHPGLQPCRQDQETAGCSVGGHRPIARKTHQADPLSFPTPPVCEPFAGPACPSRRPTIIQRVVEHWPGFGEGPRTPAVARAQSGGLPRIGRGAPVGKSRGLRDEKRASFARPRNRPGARAPIRESPRNRVLGETSPSAETLERRLSPRSREEPSPRAPSTFPMRCSLAAT